MTPDDLRQQLVVMGVSCRIHGDEVVIETCRVCGNERWNLELNPVRGLYHCWVCGTGGRLDTLLQGWFDDPNIHIPVERGGAGTAAYVPMVPGDFTSRPIIEVPSAVAFLKRRGIDMQTAVHYGLVVCTAPTHQLMGRLVLPVNDFWTGEVLGFVGRTYTNEHPKYLSTLTSRQTASGYRMRKASTPCIIVEGVFDGIAVHRAGFQVAVLLGTTAPWVLEWAARIPPSTPLAILLDGAAQEEAVRLRWLLQSVRTEPVHVIPLPVDRDPGEFTPYALTRLVHSIL